MTATQASLDALAAHTRKRSDAATARIKNALNQMRRQNAGITISSVSRRSGVSRTAIHRRKELLALIRAHQPVAAVDNDETPPPADTETSIVAALRSRLITKDTRSPNSKPNCANANRPSRSCTVNSRNSAPPAAKCNSGISHRCSPVSVCLGAGYDRVLVVFVKSAR